MAELKSGWVRTMILKGNYQTPLKCALFGTGRQATRLIDALQNNNAELVVLYSRNKERGQAFLKESKFSHAYVSDSIEEVLNNQDIEAVVIATPDFLHYEHAKIASEYGKHVYLEKPIATNLQDAEKLIKCFQRSKLTLSVGYHLRKLESLQRLKELLLQKHYGDILEMKIKWSHPPLHMDCWRINKNPWWCATMLGTHCIDLILWFFGSKNIMDVKAIKSNQLYHRLDDACEFHFRIKESITASIHCSLGSLSPLTIELVTSRSKFVFDQLVGNKQAISLNDHSIQHFEDGLSWPKMIEEFFNLIRENKSDSLMLQDCLENIKILNKMSYSSEFKENNN